MSEPTDKIARRIDVSFANEDAIILEIQRLRKGHKQAGNWSLAQACDHLDKAIRSRMQPGPFPPNTSEQDARREGLEKILLTGRLPDGIPAPDSMMPQASCDDSAIDRCIASIKTFKAYPGPITPHRLFGNLKNDEARKLNLIHCAHHLSYLVPSDEK